jgi:hypothetical protein
MGLRKVGGLVTAVIAVVVVVGLAITSSGKADAGTFPFDRYTWDQNSCSDIIEAADLIPAVLLGNCAGGTWAYGPRQQFTNIPDLYDQYLMAGDWDKNDCHDMLAPKGDTMYFLGGDCNNGLAATYSMPGNFHDYNYFVTPGDFNGDFFPDLLARSTSTGNLVLFKGNGLTLDPNPVTVVQGVQSFSQILGPGDFDHDACADIILVDKAAHQLLLDAGDCQGNFKSLGAVVPGGADLTDYDWLLAGGDWHYADGNHCPDIIGWKKSDSSNLYAYAGNCTGGINLPPQVINNPDGWGWQFASDSAKELTWGDGDCNGAVAPRDGQAALKHFLSQTELSETQPCYAQGAVVFVDSAPWQWGDWDCNGAIAPRDGQAVQAHFLEKPELSQSDPDCPKIGDHVGAAP